MWERLDYGIFCWSVPWNEECICCPDSVLTPCYGALLLQWSASDHSRPSINSKSACFLLHYLLVENMYSLLLWPVLAQHGIRLGSCPVALPVKCHWHENEPCHLVFMDNWCSSVWNSYYPDTWLGDAFSSFNLKMLFFCSPDGSFQVSFRVFCRWW